MSEKTIRYKNNLSYQRPKYTVQDRLTEEEIDEKLEDYKEVDDITTVPLGTHLRYFITNLDPQTGIATRKFRLGGVLKDKENADKYVILSNGNITWSVQVKEATFYRKMNVEEIKDEYELMIQEYLNEIKTLKKQIKSLKAELDKHRR